MATDTVYIASLSMGDSRKRVATVQFRVDATSANAWLDAATPLLRNGTSIGVLFDATLALTGMTKRAVSVSLTDEENPYVFPDANDNIYAFDKLLFGYSAGTKRYVLTIPGRDDSAYTVASDGVSLVLEDSAAVEAFVTAFEAVALADNSAVPTVEYGRVPR